MSPKAGGAGPITKASAVGGGPGGGPGGGLELPCPDCAACDPLEGGQGQWPQVPLGNGVRLASLRDGLCQAPGGPGWAARCQDSQGHRHLGQVTPRAVSGGPGAEPAAGSTCQSLLRVAREDAKWGSVRTGQQEVLVSGEVAAVWAEVTEPHALPGGGGRRALQEEGTQHHGLRGQCAS